MPKGNPNPKPGPGRKKGVPNKNTAQLRDMILKALDIKGGPEYLARQADENPGPFMGLLGKVLPTQLTNSEGGDLFEKMTDVQVDARFAALMLKVGQIENK